MPVETTVEQIEFSLAAPPAPNSTFMDWIRQGWIRVKLATTGLLLWYLASWVHDFQRIQGLEAEPTPPSKVITKNEAWQRIYSRAVHSALACSRLEGVAALE
jgi:hypothetical protein